MIDFEGEKGAAVVCSVWSFLSNDVFGGAGFWIENANENANVTESGSEIENETGNGNETVKKNDRVVELGIFFSDAFGYDFYFYYDLDRGCGFVLAAF